MGRRRPEQTPGGEHDRERADDEKKRSCARERECRHAWSVPANLSRVCDESATRE
jgi:hypothetical protein